ncbi:hypothetical protein K445DRAFT_184053 [Daldinia sp. EC12]|nr:hypothetical protein K445DRAFT_184053 [Daldinia sp. EC12]
MVLLSKYRGNKPSYRLQELGEGSRAFELARAYRSSTTPNPGQIGLNGARAFGFSTSPKFYPSLIFLTSYAIFVLKLLSLLHFYSHRRSCFLPI